MITVLRITWMNHIRLLLLLGFGSGYFFELVFLMLVGGLSVCKFFVTVGTSRNQSDCSSLRDTKKYHCRKLLRFFTD